MRNLHHCCLQYGVDTLHNVYNKQRQHSSRNIHRPRKLLDLGMIGKSFTITIRQKYTYTERTIRTNTTTWELRD